MPSIGLDWPIDVSRIPSDEALYLGAVSCGRTMRRHVMAIERCWREHPRTARLPLPPLIVTEFNAFFTHAQIMTVDGPRPLKQNDYVTTQAGALAVPSLTK